LALIQMLTSCSPCYSSSSCDRTKASRTHCRHSKSEIMPEAVFTLLIHLLLIFPAQTQIVSPLAERCGPEGANVVCINHYASVMPENFLRKPINNSFDPTQDLPFESTAIQGDESWQLAATADFLIFDRERGLELLGPSRPCICSGNQRALLLST